MRWLGSFASVAIVCVVGIVRAEDLPYTPAPRPSPVALHARFLTELHDGDHVHACATARQLVTHPGASTAVIAQMLQYVRSTCTH